ncbi:NRDE family protein, partial [Actinomadura rubrisoli]
MCTAIISFDPSSPVPVLLAGVRDEFVKRAWEPPGRHWPDRPGLVGGRDLRAGGTWLAVDPSTPRVSTVLNGRGRMAPEDARSSRGGLPLLMAADGKLGGLDLPAYDPFHLVCAEPDRVRLWSWDGGELVERSLEAGLHMIVNSGLEGE